MMKSTKLSAIIAVFTALSGCSNAHADNISGTYVTLSANNGISVMMQIVEQKGGGVQGRIEQVYIKKKSLRVKTDNFGFTGVTKNNIIILNFGYDGTGSGIIKGKDVYITTSGGGKWFFTRSKIGVFNSQEVLIKKIAYRERQTRKIFSIAKNTLEYGYDVMNLIDKYNKFVKRSIKNNNIDEWYKLNIENYKKCLQRGQQMASENIPVYKFGGCGNITSFSSQIDINDSYDTILDGYNKNKNMVSTIDKEISYLESNVKLINSEKHRICSYQSPDNNCLKKLNLVDADFRKTYPIISNYVILSNNFSKRIHGWLVTGRIDTKKLDLLNKQIQKIYYGGM